MVDMDEYDYRKASAQVSIKVMYSDLDGTMVGPGGCFVRDSAGALTMEPTRALIELLDAEDRTRPGFWADASAAAGSQLASLEPKDSSPRWAPSSAGISVDARRC